MCWLLAQRRSYHSGICIGTVDVKLRCSVDLSHDQSGFHVMGTRKRGHRGGGSFVPADWQVRLFGTSGIANRLYEHIYVRTITMSGCMEIQSRYTNGVITAEGVSPLELQHGRCTS